MAAGYAADHQDTVGGLALWAAYPSGDVSGTDLVTSSIFGTLDAGAERMTSGETRAKLPQRQRSWRSRAETTSRWAGTPVSRTTPRDHLANRTAGPGGGSHTRHPGGGRALTGAPTRRPVGVHANPDLANRSPGHLALGEASPVAHARRCSNVRPVGRCAVMQHTMHRREAPWIGGLVLIAVGVLMLGRVLLPDIGALRRARTGPRLPGCLRLHAGLRLPGPGGILTGLGIGVALTPYVSRA